MKGAFGGRGGHSRQRDFQWGGPEEGISFTCLRAGNERHVQRVVWEGWQRSANVGALGCGEKCGLYGGSDGAPLENVKQ